MTLATGFRLNGAAWMAAVAASLALAGMAGAQSQPLRLPEGQSARPTVRVTLGSQPLYRNVPTTYPAYHSYPAYPVAVMYLPAVLMSDGSVYADFGWGYRPVRRACRQSRVIDARAAHYSRNTQPAPAQRSASAEALSAVRAQREAEMRAAEMNAANACWTRSAQGGYVVVR